MRAAVGLFDGDRMVRSDVTATSPHASGGNSILPLVLTAALAATAGAYLAKVSFPGTDAPPEALAAMSLDTSKPWDRRIPSLAYYQVITPETKAQLDLIDCAKNHPQADVASAVLLDIPDGEARSAVIHYWASTRGVSPRTRAGR